MRPVFNLDPVRRADGGIEAARKFCMFTAMPESNRVIAFHLFRKLPHVDRERKREHQESLTNFPSHDRGTICQCPQLRKGQLARHIFHAAVGCWDELVGGQESKACANALGDHLGRLGGLVTEIQHAKHDIFRRQLFENAKIELGLGSLN
jgi:hypothetical protein